MSDADKVRETLTALVRSTSDQLHREDQFTVRLFASLWHEFGERMLYATGLDVKFVEELCVHSPETEAIRKTHLSKTMDFYADLILTEPLGATRLKSTLSQADVLSQAKITHLYEFKYLTAFPSLPKKRAREDTYKLKVLGEYVRLSCGHIPHMEQFIVASRRSSKYRHSVDSLLSWYSDEQIRRETSGVIVNIVDADGTLFKIES